MTSNWQGEGVSHHVWRQPSQGLHVGGLVIWYLKNTKKIMVILQHSCLYSIFVESGDIAWERGGATQYHWLCHRKPAAMLSSVCTSDDCQMARGVGGDSRYHVLNQIPGANFHAKCAMGMLVYCLCLKHYVLCRLLDLIGRRWELYAYPVYQNYDQVVSTYRVLRGWAYLVLVYTAGHLIVLAAVHCALVMWVVCIKDEQVLSRLQTPL